MQSVDQRIYNMLLEQDPKKGQGQQQKPSEYNAAFIVHTVFKAAPLVFMILRGILSPLIGKTLLIQIVLLLVVLDFWITKNITGKRMLGVRWSFEENEYGDEKFQFEGRVNEQYISGLNSKLFWVILVIYTIIPVVFIFFGILSASLNLSDILLFACILIGGATNFYFFWKASRGVNNKRDELATKLGNQFKSKMGAATIISYL